MLKETIYNFEPFSESEQVLLLSYADGVSKERKTKGGPFEHWGDMLTKDEYMRHKSDEDKLYDLFLLFRYRGDFEMAKKYEVLSNHDEVKEFENIPRDLFIKNELEYYEWRKKNQ